jgi:hypothetical protein
MSKITQIERELLIINDSVFHRLCSAYIRYKYNFNITDKGLAKGKDKPAKGTPDSYILDDGKNLFVEITTQEVGVFEKFKNDIKKCLSLFENGESIEKIFLFYNSRLDITEKNKLLELGIQNETKIEIITLDELKYDLHRPYGFLAKEFLGIETDSGQILEIDRFIYENDKKTTSLKNPFISRDSKLNEIITDSEQGNIVVLSGNPGTGKTRLAIEASMRLKEKNTSLKTYVITNKGQSIYYDLSSYFLPNHEYLIIVDDANRIGDLSRILELSILDELSVKLIITVRDYALGKIVKQFQEIDKISFRNIKIEKLSNKQIEDILSSMNITAQLCIDKITYIANGNPRLAMMASEYALETNNCYALNNVTDIYDAYFSRIINEIEELKDKSLLITLGVISFHRSFDKENKAFNDIAFKIFQISENDFWENVFILHELELVDLFEKQIVKIADQIIAEYFFYYLWVKEKIIDFSILLENYLQNYSGKIRDNLYPIISNFDQVKVMESLKGAVNNFYDSERNNDDLIYNYFEIFWFYKKTEALVWLQERIEILPLNDNFELDFDKPVDIYNIQKYPYFELLKLFGHHPDENFIISLDILFSYIKREQRILPQVVKYVQEELIFNSHSFNQSYFIQVKLFDFLFHKLSTDKNVFFYKKIILAISDRFLQVYFENTRAGVRNSNTFVLSQIYIHPTEEIIKIRSQIWEFLLAEYDNFKDEIFKILSNYIKESYASIFRYEERNKINSPAKKVAKYDKAFVLRFFEEVLTSKDFSHCKLLERFLSKFKNDGVDYSYLKRKFNSPIYELSLILKWDYLKLKRNHEVECRDELKEYKKHEIRSYFKHHKYDDYIQLLEDISFLLSLESNHTLNVMQSLEIIFLQIADCNEELLIRLLKHIFSTNNQIEFNSYDVVNALLTSEKYEMFDIYKLIKDNDFKLKSIWLQYFFLSIEDEIVDDFFYSEFIEMYKNWETNLNVRFEYWSKFKKYNPDIFITVFQILLNKTKNSDFSFGFHHWSLFEESVPEFKNNFEILKSIYIYKEDTESRFDYGNKYLKELVEIDNEFLFVILDLLCLKNLHINSPNEDSNFEFIWDYENCNYLLERAIEFLRDKYSLGDDIINMFFPQNINKKVTNFIIQFIVKYHDDKKKMKKIFNVITYTYSSKRIYFLSILLEHVQDEELIKSLGLIQGFRIAGSSFIPIYESDKKFWIEFEKLLSHDVKFLKLKLWTKQRILGCEKDIVGEQKRNFVDDF